MICENVSIFMFAPMISRTFWQWNMKMKLTLLPIPKRHIQMNIPIQHCSLFFYPLQNSYWKWFFLWKRHLVKKLLFLQLVLYNYTCSMQLKINWNFNSQKLKIQFPCSFWNSNQFKILIGFHTHTHTQTSIYLLYPQANLQVGGVCVCVGPVRMAKKKAGVEQQQLLLLLLLFPIL